MRWRGKRACPYHAPARHAALVARACERPGLHPAERQQHGVVLSRQPRSKVIENKQSTEIGA